MKVCTALVAALLVVGGGLSTAYGQLYWDLNGASPDSGSATPTGTWNAASSNWNTDSTGGAGGAITTWDGSTAIFSAGGDATGSFNITLDATQSAVGINFEEGTVDITGGTELDLTGGTVDVASTAAGTISSVVGGVSGLNKTGAGTLTLGGANLYSGVTSVSAGILAATNATSLGGLDPTNIASGASLDVSVSNAEPVGISSLGTTGTNGGLFKSGTAAVTLSGSISIDADARINNNGASGTLTLTGGVGMNSGNLSIGGTSNVTISTVALSGGGALTKDGANTLTLSGAQTYTGLTTVNAGILAANNATSLGTTAGTTVVNSGGTLQVSGGQTFLEQINISGTGSTGSNGALLKTGNNTTTIGNTSIQDYITGSGSIVVNSAGTLVLTAKSPGNPGFTGTYTVMGGGTLKFADQVNLGTTAGSGAITLDNGTLYNTKTGNAGTFVPSNRNVVLGAGGGTFQWDGTTGVPTDLIIVQNTAPGTVISGAGGLTKTGAGIIALGMAATYTGPTHVVAGTFRCRNVNDVFPTGTALTVDAGAVFDLDVRSQAVGSLTGAGSVNLTSSTGSPPTFTVGNLNTSTVFSGQFTEKAVTGGKVTKVGTGTLTLSGNNLQTGLTTISAGAIAAQTNTALGTTAGSTTISSGAQLQIDGNGLDIAETLLMSGTGLATNGALRNLANDNTASGNITINAATRIQSDGGTLSVTGTIKSSSTTTRNLTVGGAGNVLISNVIGDPAATNNIGTLTKADDGTLTLGAATGNVYTGATTVGAGKLLVNNTSGSATSTGAVTVTGTGTLGGSGFISGAVTVNSGGHVSPGASIESLDVGSLTLNTGSILDVELGTNGVSDVINVTNTDGLNIAGGSVALTAANLGDLAVGNIYTLIDYAGALTGDPAALGTPTGPAGFSYTLSNNGTETRIELLVGAAVVGVPGDYNANGVVDGADYVVWRKNKGLTGSPTVSQGNGDGDGDVDDDDYTYWRARFGNTSGSGSGSLAGGAVPEPSTVAILLIGIAAAFVCRRER